MGGSKFRWAEFLPIPFSPKNIPGISGIMYLSFVIYNIYEILHFISTTDIILLFHRVSFSGFIRADISVISTKFINNNSL